MDDLEASGFSMQDLSEHEIERVSWCYIRNDSKKELMHQFDLLNATLVPMKGAMSAMSIKSANLVFTSPSAVSHRLLLGSICAFQSEIPVESSLLQSGFARGRTLKWNQVIPGQYSLAKHNLCSRRNRLVARELFLIRRFRSTVLSQFDVHLLFHILSYMVELDFDYTLRLSDNSRHSLLNKRVILHAASSDTVSTGDGFTLKQTEGGEYRVLPSNTGTGFNFGLNPTGFGNNL